MLGSCAFVRYNIISGFHPEQIENLQLHNRKYNFRLTSVHSIDVEYFYNHEDLSSRATIYSEKMPKLKKSKMLVRSFYIISFILISASNLMTQEYFSKIYDFDKIGRSDSFQTMIEHDGYLYLIARYNYFLTENQISTATKVVKTDLDGNILNEQNFPWMLEQTDYGMNMLIEDDHLYILSRYHFAYAENKNPINLLKLNLELDSIAHVEYNPIVTNPLEAADASLTSFEDHFIATGWIDDDNSQNNGETPFLMWINKDDLSLDTVSLFPSKVIQPDSLLRAQMPYTFSNEDNSELYVFSELLTQNPSEVFFREEIGFLKYSGREDQEPEYVADTLGTYSFHNSPFLTSEGFLFYEKAGTPSTDQTIEFVLMKPDGQVIWHNKDIALNPYGARTIFHFMETRDGDLIAGGSSNWHLEYGQEDPDTITTFKSPYLIKIDIETGDILWERHIIEFDDLGNVDGGSFLNVVETEEGDLICAGSKVYKDEFSFFTYDSWILKLDENGCNPNFSCDGFAFLSSTEEEASNDLKVSKLLISPNPTSGIATVKLPEDLKDGSLRIIDNNGKQILREELDKRCDTYQIDLSTYPSGIYHVEYLPRDNKERLIYTGKVVVE
jgi:hypothetical protein